MSNNLAKYRGKHGLTQTQLGEMLGMTNLTKVIVLNNKKSGSIIIKVRGTRFALGKEFAKGIKVKAVAEWKIQ